MRKPLFALLFIAIFSVTSLNAKVIVGGTDTFTINGGQLAFCYAGTKPNMDIYVDAFALDNGYQAQIRCPQDGIVPSEARDETCTPGGSIANPKTARQFLDDALLHLITNSESVLRHKQGRKDSDTAESAKPTPPIE